MTTNHTPTEAESFMAGVAGAVGYKLRFGTVGNHRQAVVYSRKGHLMGTLFLCLDVTGHEYPIASKGADVSSLRERIRDAMADADMIEVSAALAKS